MARIIGILELDYSLAPPPLGYSLGKKSGKFVGSAPAWLFREFLAVSATLAWIREIGGRSASRRMNG